ncbi:hypothetical protein EDD15DRAFT_2373049 [Pisolithus albus]|nr:hypothetical protein EDD15DRAFT_2373049 [Pisolithus albus]
MDDDSLAHELKISKSKLLEMYGMILDQLDAIDVDAEAWASTSVQAPILSVPGSEGAPIPTDHADDHLIGGALEMEHLPYQGLGMTSVASYSRSTSEFSQFSGSLQGLDPDRWHRKGRQFKVIYIPDPSRRCCSLSECERNLGYALRTITAKTYEKLEGALPGYIFRRPGGRSKAGLVKVYISEWLWVAARLSAVLDESMFLVSYMSWERFRDGILEFDKDVVAELSRQDCLLGGIDYTIDYRSSAAYGWKDVSDIERLATNLKTIRNVIMWPPARELKRAGWKFPVIADLAAIAESQVPSCPPVTTRLNTGDTIPQGTVLKRSQSDCSAHVIMPDAARMRTWSYLMSQAPAGEIWMAQQHVPFLAKLGEWRVYIVGGKIVQVVHTYRTGNGSWHGRQVQGYWSLDELQAKILSSDITPMEVINPDEGTTDQRNHAKEEFEAFTLDTWKHLVLTEKASASGPVSISIFCRLDIGIGMENGRLMYFVNEVERSLTTSLWMGSMPDGAHGILADTLAATLYDWLTGMMDPMHL